MKALKLSRILKISKKGDIWISAALYIVISVVVITLILAAGIPMLDSMRDKNAFEDSKKTLLTLDQHITEVANEGPGSQRVVPLEIKRGTLSLNENGITWSMKTKADIIDPRTKIQTGNLIVSSNIDVNAYVENNSCVIENSKIRVTLLKIGDATNFVPIDTSSIIQEFREFRTNEADAIAEGNFTFSIGGEPNSNVGIGYTDCPKIGNDLDYASVTLYMYNATGVTWKFDYELEFILDSEGDFIKTKVSNVNIH
jgi:hypothetical protein